MSEPALTKCPKCGRKKLRRLFGTGAYIIFKGSGFYQTDYRSESYKKAAEKDKPSSESKSENKSESKSDSKSESKSETRADSKSESKSDTKTESKSDSKSETKSASKPAPAASSDK